MKKMFKFLVLFASGGSLYYLLEVLFRGYSYSAMFIAGGVCFTCCGRINERDRCMPLIRQMLEATFVIVVTEFVTGLIFNVWLGVGMWDYGNMPGNILGQICPQFTALWFFLSAVAIFLDDYLRWLLFGQEKPHYHLFKKGPDDK